MKRLLLACLALLAVPANATDFSRINGDYLVGVPCVLSDGTSFLCPTVVQQTYQGDATSRSGTMTSGGTAQQLMAANSSRHGWSIQNQSSGNLYVRSRGAAGTTDATADQNSFLVAPGATYTPDHVSPYAQSIIGATTGQAFWAREW